MGLIGQISQTGPYHRHNQEAFRLTPYWSASTVMFTMAEGTAPSPWPQSPAHITAAS